MQYPTNRQWSHDVTVLVDTVHRTDIPTFSIVMPIHNQATILYDVVTKLLVHTQGLYELFFILDGCTDTSQQELLRALSVVPAGLCKTIVVSSPSGIFETSCDNLGFVNARGKYILEIQADMQIQTLGYNLLLAMPMEIYPDLIAVSGRCCHTLTTPHEGIGKLGTRAEQPHNFAFDMYNQIFLSHTVNRGPLAIRRSMLEALGYLDEAKFVLGDDEHDLFYRAWTQKGWRTAFYPIEVYSPLAWGSTRKTRPPHVQAYLNSRRQTHPVYDASRLPPKLERRPLPNDAQLRAIQSMSL